MKKSGNRSSPLPAPSVAKASPAAEAHGLTVPNAGRVAVAIMAAGKGTRLKSQLPKVLHEVGGRSLLAHVVAAATQVVADAVGKTQTAAEAILNQIGTKSSDAQAALDAKEGKISPVNNGKDVQLGPAN